MAFSSIRYVSVWLALALSACDMAAPEQQSFDWEHVNYAKMACGGGHSTAAGCKTNDDDLSNISKSGKSSGR